MVASRTAGWLGTVGVLTALLIVAGCGCTEDAGAFTSPARSATAQIGMEIDPIEVPRPPDPGGPVKVDVVFLLDDSFFLTDRTAEPGQSVPPGEILGDGRIKTDVAQEIFQDAVDRLRARLEAEHPVDAGGDPIEYDLAFGVSRFEDYANFERSGPKASVPSEVANPIDELARPFILNQPLLQQTHPQFNLFFTSALSRETPGDGGRDPMDSQAALEALYQLATGSGFDGNGNSSKTESGDVGVLATQLTPGISGDVPPFAATEMAPLPDGSPVYSVGETLSSGNLGGAGWRPDSLRFVIVFSDVCAITPLLSGSDPDGPISNSPSPAGQGPRPAETVTSVQAFACTRGDAVLDPGFPGPTDPTSQQAYARFGLEDGTIPVASPGAVTLQATIDVLNLMNIEVMGVGFRESVGSGPNKPNLPPPVLPGEEAAVQDPKEPPQNKAPFTWMSAMAILTGARDADLTDPDPRFVPDLPLVYSLTIVNPLNTSVTDDVIEDLSDRVGAWLPFVETAGGSTQGDPGSVFYLVTFDLTNTNAELTLNPNPGFPLIPDVDPGGSDPIYVSQAGATQIVRIPCYFVGDVAPAAVRVAWQISGSRTNESNRDAILSMMPFNFTPTLADPADVPGGQNPRGDVDPADIPPLGPASGSMGMLLPALPTEPTPPENLPLGMTTLTTVTSGEALFRDVERGTPPGTSIDTMAGPLGPTDVPYPPL